MKIKNLFLVSLTILQLTSCVILKSPTRTKEFSGTVLTCISDSTSILESEKITIVESQGLNKNCPNRPKNNDEEMDRVWPCFIYFRFQDMEYWYMFDQTQTLENNTLTKVSYSTHDGDIICDRKNKLMKLKCIDFKWEKTFKYSYNKKTKTLILTEYKNGL